VTAADGMTMAAAGSGESRFVNSWFIPFGNPKAGTPLMQADPRIGIELPLRILIWQGSDRVILGYRDPEDRKQRLPETT
jgi:uncharacterized protein (DUF302 family)